MKALPFAALALFALTAPAFATDPEVPSHLCRVEGLEGREGDARCATFVVWENRATKKGRKIPIRTLVLPALDKNRLPDPLVFFAGGPGESSVDLAPYVGRDARFRQRRDLVFLDQRGTGGSHGLECALAGNPPDLRRLAAGAVTREAAEACRKELERTADLTRYTTDVAVDDFAEVLTRLGYGKVNLMGGSYGTLTAQVFLRRHPARVRTMILNGVVPVDEPAPLHHAAAGQRAVDLLFAECAADPACRAAFPKPGEELKAVMERVEKGIEVEVNDPVTQEKVKVKPVRGVVADGVRLGLYAAEDGKNQLPLWVHQAFEGDYRPLVQAALQSGYGVMEGLDMGLWLSVTCSEAVPYIDSAIVPRETAGTFLGDYRVRQQKAACEVWPRGPIPADHRKPVVSSVPTLLLSGERDPVAPPEFGDRVAKHLSQSLHVVVPHGAHIVGGECVKGLQLRLLDTGSIQGLDSSCVRDSKPAQFATEVAPAVAAAPKPAAPHPCRVDGVDEEVRCATFTVWEDRAAKKGRQIPIHVVILPALDKDKAPDPIVYLAGGPGQPATIAAGGFAQAKPLRQRRDIVLIDQRGTGRSNGLDCHFSGNPPDLRRFAADFVTREGAAACRRELEKVADLTLYTTAVATDDLAEVLQGLGYRQANLMGGSYGTITAQVFLRRHPELVRTLVLDGVAPLDEPFPLHHAAAGQRAADLLFAECAADPACHAAFPKPGEELKAVMERVDRGIEVEVTDPQTKQKVTVRPSRGVVADGVRFGLYSAEDGKNALPLRIRQAFLGDYRPLVQTALENSLGLDSVLDLGMWLSVTCAENIAAIDPASVPRETAGTFLGDFRVRQQMAACEVWPLSPVPPDHRKAVESPAAVLLLSGERDPVTPPEFGERVAKHLPNSLHVVVPHGGHGADGDCALGIQLRFLEAGSAKGLDTSCLKDYKPAQFATE